MLLSSCFVVLAFAAGCRAWYGPNIAQVQNFTLIKTSNASSAYLIDSPESDYGIPVYLVDLHGRFLLACSIDLIHALTHYLSIYPSLC
jgi:hypothetical protein